ncbi:MAG: hypothetical protein CMJ84_09395 [Planctomycetes bacterium]|nr:hypothetical protein [Planctomycetota bacterium]MDP6408371.1 hypothetical protein [Planctomycetota bacterium]
MTALSSRTGAHTAGRAPFAAWRSLLLLAVLAALPCALGFPLPRAWESALSPRLPMWTDASFRDAELVLRGPDGSRVRLNASSLRLEAAHTPGLVSAAKALVARDAVLRPLGAERPAWSFRRLELTRENGPHAWFGPVGCTRSDGSVEASEASRGSLSIVSGEVRWRPASR